MFLLIDGKLVQINIIQDNSLVFRSETVNVNLNLIRSNDPVVSHDNRDPSASDKVVSESEDLKDIGVVPVANSRVEIV